jgi:hypothetical protein
VALRDYTEIIERYGSKIEIRIAALAEQFEDFVKSIGIDPATVSLPMDLLYEVVLNYFADIHRIKEFHEIERANTEKISAYTAYWILRIKPIQVVVFKPEKEDAYKLINEYFAANVLLAYLFDTKLQMFNSADLLSKWNKFFRQLIYTFHYRPLDPQLYELAIVALLTEAPHRLDKKNE